MLKRSHVVVPARLLQFLKEWLAWAEGKADNSFRFKTTQGLCLEYYRWSSFEGRQPDEHHLRVALRRSGLDTTYPFGTEEFIMRSREGTMHLCPKRLAWVKQIIEDNQGVI